MCTFQLLSVTTIPVGRSSSAISAPAPAPPSMPLTASTFSPALSGNVYSLLFCDQVPELPRKLPLMYTSSALSVLMRKVACACAGGAGSTVIDRAWVAVLEAPSCTCTVKLLIPSAVGVPLIAPVTASSVSPAGSAPPTTLQL